MDCWNQPETTDVGVTNVILIFGHSDGDITAQSARLRHATVASCSNLKSQMGTVDATLPITECIQPGLLQTRPEEQNEKANELRRRRTILETMPANFLPPKTWTEEEEQKHIFAFRIRKLRHTAMSLPSSLTHSTFRFCGCVASGAGGDAEQDNDIRQKARVMPSSSLSSSSGKRKANGQNTECKRKTTRVYANVRTTSCHSRFFYTVLAATSSWSVYV